MNRRAVAAPLLGLVCACAGAPASGVDEGTAGATEVASTSTGDVASTDTSSSTGVDPSTSSEASSGSTGMVGSSDGGSETGPVPSVPADLLPLDDWKLTLPVADPRDPDAPREVLQPELATFWLDPYFVLDRSATAVVFRAHAGGVTTSNSGYPRSELREMAPGGSELASWSTSEGTHTMTITQAITHLPEVKPHVVAGQIHDAEDDVVMIRLEGEHLFVEGGGDELGDLEPAYALGTVFTVVLAAHDGVIEIFYEDLDTPAVTIDRDVDGCYFKAGAYTQSNEEQGDDAQAYGQVEIRELVVEHTP